MANHNLLPTLLQQKPHIQAFDDMAESKLDAYDISPVLIYHIDSIPASALPSLAAQFHITGYEGWRYALTESDQRELLKRAISMHRYKGTPWSISEAVKMLGFPSTTFEEGVGMTLDGTWFLGGSFTLGSCFWAIFNAVPDATNYGPITPAIISDLTNIINEWKPVRSRLRDIIFTYYFTLNVSTSDINALLTFLLDGSQTLDGTWYLGNALIEFIQFGINGASSASFITSPINKAPLVSYPQAGVIQVMAELDTTEGNGITFREFGMLEFDGTTLFDRQPIAPIQKDNTMRIRALWTINYS